MNGERARARSRVGSRGLILLAAAFGIGAIVFAAMSLASRNQAPSELASLGAGLEDVTLTSAHGDLVRWGELKGRPRAVFFGFTHCPVICPVTVWELNDAMDRIGGPAEAIAIEFVTVDPERDTPDRLRSYFQGFGARVNGYTGSREAVARMMRGFEIEARRTDLANGSYTIDHTATVFLVDETGRVVDVVAFGSPPEIMEERLRALAGLT